MNPKGITREGPHKKGPGGVMGEVAVGSREEWGSST